MKPRCVYSPVDILRLVRLDAAAKLGLAEFRLVLKPANLGQIAVGALDEGKPLGPFVFHGRTRIMVADRVDSDVVVLEDPFHQRGAYPIRVSMEKFRRLRAADVRKVRAEFLRVVQPFPPRGWETLCGIPPKIALKTLLAARGECA